MKVETYRRIVLVAVVAWGLCLVGMVQTNGAPLWVVGHLVSGAVAFMALSLWVTHK